nr:HDOD domain-containing protein [Pleionea sp. CnH1-48]
MEECKHLINAADTLGVEPNQMLRCVLLQGDSKRYMAVLPASHLLDFEALRNLKADEFNVIDDAMALQYFRGCDQGYYPPVPDLFGFEGVVDSSVFEQEQVFIHIGHGDGFLRLERRAIDLVFSAFESMSFACGPEKLYSGRSAQEDCNDAALQQFTPIRIKQRIDETFDLPAMPDIAQEIMKLRVDPSADARKLGEIVARDPSLAAQIISWASSPYYGYKGTIDSVETAISRVLGFDLVMNLALGISIGKSLNVAVDGPLGVRAFWKQSVYCASLVEKLCLGVPPKQRPERGLSYLAGLLHNFGHLLLGHLFPPQFLLVNRYVEANPYIHIEDIEHFVLGVTHEEMGAWLMKNWHMPDELIVSVRWHHKEEFWSKHAVYSNLVLLANRLLKRIEIGDACRMELPQSTLELLSLEESKVMQSFESLLEERDVLDMMSKQLVA